MNEAQRKILRIIAEKANHTTSTSVMDTAVFRESGLPEEEVKDYLVQLDGLGYIKIGIMVSGADFRLLNMTMDGAKALQQYFFHVAVEGRSQEAGPRYDFNYNEVDLMELVVKPYHNGNSFFLDREIVDPFEIKPPRIFRTIIALQPLRDEGGEYHLSLEELKQVVKAIMAGEEGHLGRRADHVREKLSIEEVTRSYIRYPPQRGGVRPAVRPEAAEAAREPTRKYDRKKIFIVHGHDETSKYQLAEVIRELGLEPVILHTKANAGRTIIEKFEEHSANIGYAFVLLTPDDVGGTSKDNLEPRARQNVILELGYFMGKLRRERVCCIYKGDLDPPCDIKGVAYYPYQNSVDECYGGIAKELREAEYIS
jgi:predicted nucleotide-binding protein